MENFKRDEYIFSSTSLMVDVGHEKVKLRAEQVKMLVDEISLYGVFVKDLVSHYPTYKYRNMLINIVYYIIESPELYENILNTRKLPIKKIAKYTKVAIGFLENWQDYLVTYFIIMSSSKYKNIQEALNIDEKEKSVSVIPFTKKQEDLFRGIVISIDKSSVIILTTEGEFIRIKRDDHPVTIGGMAHGREKKGLMHYKFHICLGIIFLMLCTLIAYVDYNKVNSTVILTTTSQIKLEINKGNKVVYMYSGTDKGTNMLNEVNPIDKGIDEVLKACIEYASENEMIPDDGLLVTVNGKALKYGVLEETGEYVVDNNISIEINNAGSLHNIYDFITTKRQKESADE